MVGTRPGHVADTFAGHAQCQRFKQEKTLSEFLIFLFQSRRTPSDETYPSELCFSSSSFEAAATTDRNRLGRSRVKALSKPPPIEVGRRSPASSSSFEAVHVRSTRNNGFVRSRGFVEALRPKPSKLFRYKDNMGGRCLRNSKPSSNGEELTECMVNLPAQQFKHGDIVWSRINGESWWPVQVADEKCVACKPKKIKNDQILVRLYGSFEHMYVEAINCVSEIEKIFGQENSSNREVFQKTLEEDLTRIKSGGQSVATVSESKEIAEIEKEKDGAPRGKGQMKGKLKRTMLADNSPLASSSDNPKAAKQVKVVMSEGMDAAKASEVGITKRRTRSETIKSRNEGTCGIEVSNEAGNVNNGASTMSSLDKKDLSSSRCKDGKEKLTLNVLDKASESKCVTKDCGRNPYVNQNAQIEFSDVKDIKKLVAKIVKEVAEKTRNEALKGEGMENCPENVEYIDSSRKKSSGIKNMKRHIPRRMNNKDIVVHVTDRAINDTQDIIAGPSDVRKPNGADKLSNGASLVKIRHFDCNNNERTKDTCIEIPNSAERANDEIQRINGVHRSKSHLKKMNGDAKSQSNFAKQDEAMQPSETKKAIHGNQRGKVVKKDVSRQKMDSPITTKCFLSPRCTRVMQSLGLIAPLGSPFCRNGLIRSLLP